MKCVNIYKFIRYIYFVGKRKCNFFENLILPPAIHTPYIHERKCMRVICLYSVLMNHICFERQTAAIEQVTGLQRTHLHIHMKNGRWKEITETSDWHVPYSIEINWNDETRLGDIIFKINVSFIRCPRYETRKEGLRRTC